MRFLGIIVLAAAVGGSTMAQQTSPPSLPAPQPLLGQGSSPKGAAPAQPAQPPGQLGGQPPTQPQAPAPTDTSQFGQGATGGLGGLAEGGLTTNLIGDFAGFTFLQTIFVPVTQTTTTIITNPEQPPQKIVTTKTVLVPVSIFNTWAGRAGSGFEIGENASPLPQDRIYFSYNYYNHLGGAGGFTPGSSTTTTTATVLPDSRPITFQPAFQTSTTVMTPNTTVPTQHFDLHREMLGFEKTFFDGNASIEVRLPVFEQNGLGDVGPDEFGDTTLALKYAFFKDRTTGNVFSGGLAVTAPTSRGIDLPDGTLHDWLIQPFIGYLVNFGPAYVHGFTSIVIPTDDRDATVLFEDLGIGYRLFQSQPGSNRFVNLVAPTLEVHVTTPLDHRHGGEIQVPDIVSFTAGVHVGMGQRSLLTIGVNTPVTGPTPYTVEAILEYNLRF